MEWAEFIEMADRLDRARAAFTSEHEPLLQEIGQAAAPFARAWSGSNIGYHASVYYEDFVKPPAGAHFSQQWEFEQTYAGETRGAWREYRHEDVVHAIYRDAGDPDLAATRASAADAVCDRAVSMSDGMPDGIEHAVRTILAEVADGRGQVQ